MAHDVVHGDAAGEGDTALELLGLLAGESLLDFSLDELVDGLADGVDVSSVHTKSDGLFEGLCKSKSSEKQDEEINAYRQ